MAWNETTREKYKRSSDRHESDLSDEERLVIEPLLPAPSRPGRRRTVDLRAVPKRFPPFATVRNHFCAWRDDGVLERMMDALRDLARMQAGRSGDPAAAAIDSQPVKTTEMGGPSGCGAGKRIKGRKRHATVDVEGFPIAVRVHAADMQDRDGAPAVILAVPEKAPEVRKLWADGGHAGPKPEAALAEHGPGSILEIVPGPRETRGFTVPCRRWVVERTFAWLSWCRRLAKDVERTPASSLAWVQLAACRFLTRRLARGAAP